jgi:hypothetical protein
LSSNHQNNWPTNTFQHGFGLLALQCAFFRSIRQIWLFVLPTPFSKRVSGEVVDCPSTGNFTPLLSNTSLVAWMKSYTLWFLPFRIDFGHLRKISDTFASQVLRDIALLAY